MIKNKIYEAPEAELLEVRFEEGFLIVSGDGTITNATEEDYNEL
jgi:hypothetical protein